MTSADIYVDMYECTTPPSKERTHALIAKYKKLITREEEEMRLGHDSFDHWRIIAICEQIIKDLEDM